MRVIRVNLTVIAAANFQIICLQMQNGSSLQEMEKLSPVIQKTKKGNFIACFKKISEE